MYLYLLSAIACNILKILYKSDMEAYHAGYYHSLEQSIQEPEMSEHQRSLLLNRLQVHYENKARMDFLLDPQNALHEKMAKIEPEKRIPLDLTKGGLFNDWWFSIDLKK